MNIFALSNDVYEIAQWQVDRHCVKMILESAQMLSTAHRILDGKPVRSKSSTGRNVVRWHLDEFRDPVLYAATHGNHPCSLWTMQTTANYNWHHRLFAAMLQEYTYRYGKHHKCEELVDHLMVPPCNLPAGKLTTFAIAMPDEVKVGSDPIASYRNYYITNKVHIAKWTKREPPFWYQTF